MSKKLIAELEQAIALRDAMCLKRYALVPTLDKSATLSRTTELSPMKQPLGRGYAVTREGVFAGTFTAQRESIPSGAAVLSWHETRKIAMGAYRNLMAQRYAEKLVAIDREIEALHDKELVTLGADTIEEPVHSGLTLMPIGDGALQVSTVDPVEQQEQQADALAQQQGVTTELPSADDGFTDPEPPYAAAKRAAQHPDPREQPEPAGETVYKPGKNRRGGRS